MESFTIPRNRGCRAQRLNDKCELSYIMRTIHYITLSLAVAIAVLVLNPHHIAKKADIASSPKKAGVAGSPVTLPPVTENSIVPSTSLPMADFPSVLEKWSEETSEDIRAALESDSSNQQQAATLLFPALMELNIQFAAALAQSIEKQPYRDQFLRQVATAWAHRDARAALLWATELNRPEERQFVLSTVLLTIGEIDPTSALTAAHNAGLKTDVSLTEDLALQWAATDLNGATAWVLQLPPSAAKDTALSRLVFLEAQTQPEAAVNLVVNDMSAGPAQDEMAISVLHQWALKDFSGAQAWLDLFPDDLRERGRQELENIARIQNAAQ